VAKIQKQGLELEKPDMRQKIDNYHVLYLEFKKSKLREILNSIVFDKKEALESWEQKIHEADTDQEFKDLHFALCFEFKKSELKKAGKQLIYSQFELWCKVVDTARTSEQLKALSQILGDESILKLLERTFSAPEQFQTNLKQFILALHG